MKNFVFAFLLFPLFVACNGQSKPEKENISDETQSVLSNEPENVPVHLNKVQFLDKVADYEKNPTSYQIKKGLVTYKTKISTDLARSGGVAISLIEATPADKKALKKWK